MEGLSLFPDELKTLLTPYPSPANLLPFMAKDKKVLQTGQLRLVLPVLPLGTLFVGTVSPDAVVQGIEKAHAYLERPAL
jgi:hypothetical protein